MKRSLFIILVLPGFILQARLNARPLDTNTHILLGWPEPLQQKLDLRLAKLIQSQLQGDLQSSGYQVHIHKISAQKILQSSAGTEAAFLIGIFYQRTRSGQINLYAQIYDPAQGQMIDAVAYRNLFDRLNSRSRKLAADFKVRDSEATREFSVEIRAHIAFNPSRVVRQENILENATTTPVDPLLTQKIDAPANIAGETFQLLEEQEVITATRTPTRLRDAPAAVYVLNERQIKERGYRTLVDALHDVPGFDIIHIYGIFPDLIHQRGLVGNNQRTLLYVDGVPDNNITENAVLGGSLRFPLQNVDRIEIVAGPASALYGANAFNGVINIITKDGSDGDFTQIEAMYGAYESNFRFPGKALSLISRGSTGESENPESFQYSVHAQYYRTAGPYFGEVGRLDQKNYDPNDSLYALETEGCGQQCHPDSSSVGHYWSPLYNMSRAESYNITARFARNGFRFQTVNWQYLQGQGTFSNATQTIDSDYAHYEGSAWDFRNNSMAVGYNYEFGENLNLDTEIIARHTELLSSSHEQTPKDLSPGFEYRPYDLSTSKDYSRPDHQFELNQKLQWNYSRKASTTLGGQASYSQVPQGYNSHKRYTFRNYAGYLQQYWRLLNTLALTGGYRYDNNTIYGISHTPRVGAVYNATENLTLKFLYSTGFRAPTAWESFNATRQRKANPDLKPERMTSIEGGIGYRLSKRFYISATHYVTQIRDLLLEVETAQPNPNVPGANFNQNQNVGRARIAGVELDSDINLNKRLSLYLNYTYSHGEYYDLPDTLTASPSTRGRIGDDYLRDYINETQGTNLVPDKGPIPNIASHHVNMGYTYRFYKNFSWHLRANYVDLRRTIATNPEKTTEGYLLWHTNLRFEDIFRQGFYLQFLVKNITDERFFDPGIRTATGAYYPTRHPIEGRNIWISLGYRF